ncbi:MAG: O-antigen ligase family protein [Candidatus Brocadiaceae bacterium]|nr:O-antigen ligase family protein [Candidatus Brocadiaceae bacterium]
MRGLTIPVFHNVPFIPLFFGIFTGIFLVSDPFLASFLAKMLDVSIGSKNIFKLFPYEISSCLFLFSLFLPFIRKLVLLTRMHAEKAFITLFLGGMHITSLTTFAKIDLSELILVVSLFVLFVKSFVKGRKLCITLLDIFNMAFVVAVLISFMNTGIIPFVVYAPTLVKFILILLLFSNLIYSKELLVFSLKCIVVLTCISSLIGIGQEILFKTTGLLLIGVVDKKNLSLLFEFTSQGAFLRVPAFFGTYKPFTFFLTTAILLVCNYFIYNRPFALKKRLMLIFAFFLMTTALLLTFSMDGLLSLFIGLIFSLLMRWRNFIIHAFFCVLIVVVAICLLGLLDDIQSAVSTSYQWGEYRIRFQLAREGILGFIHRHPLIGTGISDVYHYTSHHHNWAAHNAFIEAADAVGLLGFFFYIVLLSYTFYNLIKVSLIAKSLIHAWISRGLFSGYIAYMITIQFHPFFYERFTWLYLGLVNAYVIIVKRKAQRPDSALS